MDRASGSVGIFPEIVQAEEKAAFGVPREELLNVRRKNRCFSTLRTNRCTGVLYFGGMNRCL